MSELTTAQRLAAVEAKQLAESNTSSKLAKKALDSAVKSVKEDLKNSLTNLVVGKIDPLIVTGILTLPTENVSDELGKEAYRTVRRYINWVFTATIAVGIIAYFKIKAYIGAPASVWTFITQIFGN